MYVRVMYSPPKKLKENCFSLKKIFFFFNNDDITLDPDPNWAKI